MKDNFSSHSAEYARFRPAYPAQLFSFLFQHCRDFDTAWDCGTGNGQIALQLAERFLQVEATDISENQLKNAMPHPKVRYSLQAAETPLFAAESFDLIVVGQAAHWFSLERFYEQVKRVRKQNGLLALVGYNLLSTGDAAIDHLIKQLYTNVLGGYWDVERRWVDAAYASLPFPFQEIEFPDMCMQYAWSRHHLLGYLGTWSAVQHFTQKNGHTPLDEPFITALTSLWPDEEIRTVKFPIFGRVGR